MGIAGYVAKEFAKDLGNKSRDFYEFVMPAVDVVEDVNEIVIMIDLPGFAKKDIGLNINGNILSVKAKREKAEEAGMVYYRQRPLQIDKKIVLPISVKEEDKVLGKATYIDGVVTIRVPLPKTSRIPIT
jgi:HSP20 family protein